MTATSEQPSFPIIGLEETDSTNRYLSDLCDNAPSAPAEYTTVTARFQTSGKGQRGNSWESEAGQNLLFSTVLYPRFVEARRQFVLSQIVSLAVKEELDTYTEGISIKWPNDIYWHEKKICGMLIENVLEGNRIGRCIPGIGINIQRRMRVGAQDRCGTGRGYSIVQRVPDGIRLRGGRDGTEQLARLHQTWDGDAERAFGHLFD